MPPGPILVVAGDPARPGSSPTGWRISSPSSTSRRSRPRDHVHQQGRGDAGERGRPSARSPAAWVSRLHAAFADPPREATLLGYRSSFSIYDSGRARSGSPTGCAATRTSTRSGSGPPAARADQRAQERARACPARYAAMAVGPAERRISDVYTEYQRRLQEIVGGRLRRSARARGAVVQRAPEALERYRKRFRHVLVDEFQDTNAAQWELVRLLSEEHRSVMVVGDLDQCLVAGTAITMADGATKPIELVDVGDEVLSSYGSGDFRAARVARTHESRAFSGVDRARKREDRQHPVYALAHKKRERRHRGRRPEVPVPDRISAVGVGSRKVRPRDHTAAPCRRCGRAWSWSTSTARSERRRVGRGVGEDRHRSTTRAHQSERANLSTARRRRTTRSYKSSAG